MYVLYKKTWGDFDIQQQKAVAVCDSKEVLQLEAAKRNVARKDEDFNKGEGDFNHSFEVGNKVEVL